MAISARSRRGTSASFWRNFNAAHDGPGMHAVSTTCGHGEAHDSSAADADHHADKRAAPKVFFAKTQ